MNTGKVTAKKLLFVVSLGLLTILSSNAMDPSKVQSKNIQTKSNKPKKRGKKHQRNQASDAKNADLFSQNLERARKDLARTKINADLYQAEQAKWKKQDRRK